MNKKLSLVSVLLFVLILAVVAIGCSNVLLKPHQSNPSIRVQLEKSSGARNATTGDYQITAWIENRDGTESHHQEINSTAGADASIIFEELVIGSEIKIHLELMENNDTQKKFTGTSSWTTVNEGTNVIVIVLKEASDTGEMDGPVSGDDPEVTASIGDIVYSDGTISTSLESGKIAVGIVVKTTNSQPSLILALNDSDTNTATYVTYSAAETACASYGTTCGDGKTWRIPTLDELEIVSDSLSTFQTALTRAGGTEMERSAMYYWTTTKSGSNYQRILMTNGSTVAADANATHTRARFVRDWQ